MAVEWLNYHHLYYFWTVVREGTVAAAAKRLRLAQPTVSAQVHALEESMGVKLLTRSGRHLIPTEAGQEVYRYAEDIFRLGQELADVVKGRAAPRSPTLTVGIVDVVPKLVAYRLLEPALNVHPRPRLVCLEAGLEVLLSQLAVHALDLVVSDAPVPLHLNLKAYNHLLGECPVVLMATDPLASKLRRGFPASLNGAPMLLPLQGTELRRGMDTWLREHDLHPDVVGEFEDTALLKVFGQSGAGVFCAPAAVREDVAQQYGAKEVGLVEGLPERFYFIAAERRLKNPAVVAICQAARRDLFAGDDL